MTKKDRIITSALIVWTFLHCFLMLKTINNSNQIKTSFLFFGKYKERDLHKTDLFYPFTKMEENKVMFWITDNFNLNFYDYTEFFVYIGGAWGLFFIYKLLSKKEELK